MLKQARKDEQMFCGLEAAELLMLACDYDPDKAYQILDCVKQRADPSLSDFFGNVMDGITAIGEGLHNGTRERISCD